MGFKKGDILWFIVRDERLEKLPYVIFHKSLPNRPGSCTVSYVNHGAELVYQWTYPENLLWYPEGRHVLTEVKR